MATERDQMCEALSAVCVSISQALRHARSFRYAADAATLEAMNRGVVKMRQRHVRRATGGDDDDDAAIAAAVESYIENDASEQLPQLMGPGPVGMSKFVVRAEELDSRHPVSDDDDDDVAIAAEVESHVAGEIAAPIRTLTQH
jgi:hypothetical protein